MRQLVHSVESLKIQHREQHQAMMSKLDELIKVSSSKGSKKQHEAPQNQNYPEYGLPFNYTEEDFR